MAKIKTFQELSDVRWRFFFEQTYGKSIKKAEWENLKARMLNVGLELNDSNFKSLGLIKKSAPRVFRQEESFDIILQSLQRLQGINAKISGFEIYEFCIKLIEKRNEDSPHPSSIYRWFKETSQRGYKAYANYSKEDFAIAAIYALNFKAKQPKEKRIKSF